MGTRLAWPLLAGLLAGSAGCDLVFKVDKGLPPPDDGDGADASIDAPVPTGFDEDGDTIDDALDNCPGISNNQSDGDKDGVGDACDLGLGPDDRIVARFFFNDTTDLTAFATTGWAAIDGALQASGTELATLISKLTLPDASVTAEVGFRLLAEGTNLSQTGVGIDGVGGHRCAVRDADAIDGNVSSNMLVTLASNGISTFGIPELVVGGRYHLRLTRDPPGTNDVTCRIDADAHPGTYNQPTVPGEVIIFDEGVPAQIEYVVFYGRR